VILNENEHIRSVQSHVLSTIPSGNDTSLLWGNSGEGMKKAV